MSRSHDGKKEFFKDGPFPIFMKQVCRVPVISQVFTNRKENSVDTDEIALLEAS